MARYAVPLLTARRSCHPQHPCRRWGDQCGKCEALKYLKESDWYLIQFFRQVEDQYINQTPNGVGEGQQPILTVRLEGYESALRMHGYPEELWGWLSQGARTLHRLVRKLDVVSWHQETGKPLSDVTPADLGC